MESSEDNMVAVGDGTKRRLVCGTEKGRHKCKNHRTAGNSNNMITSTCINFYSKLISHKQYAISLISYNVYTVTIGLFSYSINVQH